MVSRAKVWASIALGCPACALEEPAGAAGEFVDRDRGSIINGIEAFDNPYGVVRLGSNAGLCTGTLLTHAWVLTAAHCVDVAAQTGVSVILDDVTTQSQAVVVHPTLDVALVVLAAPVSIRGLSHGYSLPVYTGDNASLTGRALDCWGFGRDSYAAGAGVLRHATLRVAQSNGTLLVYERNELGQIQWRGDSGGSCLLNDAGASSLTGVNSACSHDGVGSVFACLQLGPEAYREWLLSLPFNRGRPLAADVDGNGGHDLAFAWYGGPEAGLTIQTALLAPDGSVTTRTQRLGDDEAIWNRGQPLVGDFDADGRGDLAFAWYAGVGAGLRVDTKLSSGDARFTAISQSFDERAGSWDGATARAGDFNGDGRADLVFAWPGAQNGGLEIRTLLAQGNGTWSLAAQKFTDRAGIWNRGLPLVGDFNGDGRDDLVFAWYSGPASGLELRLKFANGNGAWSSAVHRFGDGFAIWNQGPPLVADVNGDGRDDLVFAWHAGARGLAIDTKLSNRNGTWSAVSQYFPEGVSIWNRGTPLVGDIDGDGRSDLAFAWHTGSTGLHVRTKLSRGDGTWTAASTLLGDGDEVWNGGGPAAADVNGDGRTDLVFALRTGGRVLVRAKLSQGNGQFSARETSL